jgi:LPS export ABC transporter protein LptC
MEEIFFSPSLLRKKNAGRLLALVLFCALGAASCSFDYGDADAGENSRPDITMKNVEYMRMKNGEPQVKLQAVQAERYDKKNVMNLEDYQFDQYDPQGGVDAAGEGGKASVDLSKLAVSMEEGIKINVESEDITMRTEALNYNDTTKQLDAPQDELVTIDRSDGTSFQGTGLQADVRARTFAFEQGASGIWVQNIEDATGAAITGAAIAGESATTELPGFKEG